MFLPSNNDAKLLGQKVDVYRWRLLYAVMLMWFAFSIAIVFTVGLPNIVAPALIFLTGLWVIWEMHPRIVLYENGFIRRAPDRTDICYWHQIWLINDYSDNNGNPIQLSITQQRGFEIPLLPIYTRYPALANTILQTHIVVNHDNAMNTLQSGKSVRFGPLQLFEDHIAVGTKQIPIATIQTIHLDPQGGIQFQIYDADSEKLIWMGFSRSRIPNRHLLQHLIRVLQNRPDLADSSVRSDTQSSSLETDSDPINLPSKTYRSGAFIRLLGLISLTQFALLLILQIVAPGLFFGAMVAFGIFGLFLMARYYFMRPIRVTIDSAGITLMTSSETQRLRWTDITTLNDQISSQPLLRRTANPVRLIARNGQSFDIPNWLVQRPQLIDRIHTLFTDLHLPPSIQQLDEGQTLTFGPCTLTDSILTLDDRRIPVADIAYLHVTSDGALDIHVQTPQESKHITSPALIPNRRLLIDIITHLKLRAESTIIYPDEEEFEIPDRLQLEEIDDPTITASLENTDTLESAT